MEHILQPIKNFGKDFMTNQYIPKIFPDPQCMVTYVMQMSSRFKTVIQ